MSHLSEPSSGAASPVTPAPVLHDDLGRKETSISGESAAIDPDQPASASQVTDEDLAWVEGGGGVGAEGPDVHPVGPRSDWLRGRGPWQRTDALIALVIGSAFVLIAFVFRASIRPTDPLNYVRSAINFPTDDWVPLGYTRYGMILPIIPLVKAFGNAEIVYYFWPLLGTGILATSIYLLAVRFWSRQVAIVAVILSLASPVMFANFSRGYPDIQSAGTSTLALVVVLIARDRLHIHASRADFLLVATGLLLGWSFEAKETTVFLWPLVIAVVIGRARPIRNLSLIVAGMMVWAVTDVLIGAFGYGDALLRVHAFTRQDLSKATIPADVAVLQEFVGRSRSFYLSYIPRTLFGSRDTSWVLVAGVVGLLGLFSRKGGSRFVALILAISYGGFVAITGALSPDHPSGRIDIWRYWISFFPFVGLAAAGVGSDIFSWIASLKHGAWLRQRWVYMLGTILLLVWPLTTLSGHLVTYPPYSINGGDQLSRLRTHLSGTTETVRIFTDYRTQRMLPIYERDFFGGEKVWSGQFFDINRMSSKPASGDFVIINSLGSNSCEPCGQTIRIWLDKEGGIPPDWVEVWTTPNRNLVMYRVEGGG